VWIIQENEQARLMRMARPIEPIREFKGKAAEWMLEYLENEKPDPEKVKKRRERDREIARKIKRRK